MVARYMAISESLERWAFHVKVNDFDRDLYGFDRDASSNGMAAFPGLFSSQCRKKAYWEALERFCVIAWWDGRLAARTRPTGWTDVIRRADRASARPRRHGDPLQAVHAGRLLQLRACRGSRFRERLRARLHRTLPERICPPELPRHAPEFHLSPIFRRSRTSSSGACCISRCPRATRCSRSA